MTDMPLLAPATDPEAILHAMCLAAWVPLLAACILAIAVLFGGPRR